MINRPTTSGYVCSRETIHCQLMSRQRFEVFPPLLPRNVGGRESGCFCLDVSALVPKIEEVGNRNSLLPRHVGGRESEFPRTEDRRSRESEFPRTKTCGRSGIGVPSYREGDRESEFPRTKSRESEFPRTKSRESEFPRTEDRRSRESEFPRTERIVFFLA